jgi:hypothetical protein
MKTIPAPQPPYGFTPTFDSRDTAFSWYSISSPLNGWVPMPRRIFQFITFVSTTAFLLVALCIVRQHFAGLDVFKMFFWNPSTRTYTEVAIYFDDGGFTSHVERTKAIASDDTSVAQARAGNSNIHFTHDRRRPYNGSGRPIVWGDHFWSTPLPDIKMNGATEWWTLEFSRGALLALFGFLPLLTWTWKIIRHWRRVSRRGFDVVSVNVDSAEASAP